MQYLPFDDILFDHRAFIVYRRGLIFDGWGVAHLVDTLPGINRGKATPGRRVAVIIKRV